MDGQAIETVAFDVPSVLASYALLQPDRAAILTPGREPLSYAALNEQQDYVNQILGGWGFRRGDTVAVLLPKGPEMAVATAVLPATATVLPLDPGLSEDDYENLFQRCAAQGLIAPKGIQHAARSAARRSGLCQIDLIASPEGPAGKFTLFAEPGSFSLDPRRKRSPDVAYIMTSSGTSAQCKLIPYDHEHMVRYALAMRDWFNYEPGDTSLHLVPMYFAHGIKFVLMGALLLGTSVVCPTTYTSASFFSLVDEYQPTLLSAGFTVYRDILRHADNYPDIVSNASFRFMRATSGRLETEEITRLEEFFDAPLIVGFSSAETGIISNSPLPPHPNKPGSVGLPATNEVTIRDALCNPVDVNREGEICVRGPLVFHGYLDDSVASDKAFDHGWYRTGDLGKFDNDGFLFLSGRINEVINCGGVKISPVELDSCLESHPHVAEAAAFGIPHRTLGEVAVAAVVPVAGKPENERTLKQYLLRNLAGPKIPRKIYFVDHLPRTKNGKIQRKKLRDTIMN